MRHKSRPFLTALALFASLLFSGGFAMAESNQLITYQGRILRPDGTPLEGNVKFNIKIYSPGPSSCLLWAETQTLPMLGSMGAFSLQIGRNSNRLTGANGGGVGNFNQTFINNPSMTINSPQCENGNSYTPNIADDRNMSVTFEDAGQVIKVVDLPIKSVPFAMQAEQIGGYSVNYLFKIAGTAQAGDKATGLFSRDAMNILHDLAHLQDFGGRTLKNIGTPAAGTDAVNKDYVDNIVGSVGTNNISVLNANAPLEVSGTGNTRTLSLGTSGVAAAVYGSEIMVPQITVDQWGRITFAEEKAIPLAAAGVSGLVQVDTSTGLTLNGGTIGLTLPTIDGSNFGSQAQNTVFAAPTGSAGNPSFRTLDQSDIPVLTAAGKVENSATTATSANTPNAIITRGSTGSFAANDATLNSLTLDNGFGSTVSLKTPTALTPYTLTLPADQGQADDILTVDALGNLVWKSAANSGAVTFVDLAVPGELAVTGGPIAGGAGTLSVSWNTQTPNLVFASPTGAVGAPGFRALEASDIPNLDTAKLTSGTLGVDRGGTGLVPAVGDANKLYGINAAGDNGEYKSLLAGSGVTVDLTTPGQITLTATGLGGTVTEIASGTGLLGGPITTNGTLSVDVGVTDGKIVQVGSGDKIAVSLVPNLDTSILTSGTLGVERGGTGLVPGGAGDANKVYGLNAAGDNGEYKSVVAGSGVTIDLSQPGTIGISATGLGGTVFNIGAVVPTYMTVSPSAITTSGTFDFSFNTQTGNMVFAAPTGGGAPDFRLLEPSDIPSLDTAKLTSGTLGVGRGGTGLSSLTPNALIMANATGDAMISKDCASDGEILVWNSVTGWTCEPKTAGAVTNVGLVAPTSIFTVAGGPVTSAGTFDITLNNQNQNLVFAAPTGSAGAPGFRSLDPSDIPNLDTAKLTSGTLGVERGGTGLTPSAGDANKVYGINAAGDNGEYKSVVAGSGVTIDLSQPGTIGISATGLGGTVFNIGAVVPSYMTVSPSAITSAGTFDFSFNSQTANMVFAAPTGGSGAPDFRLLAPSDIPNLDTAKLTSGTLGVDRGGTGLTPSVSDANKVYGINAAGTDGEYKTVVAGSGVTIDLSQPGSISISATGLGGTVTEVTGGTGLLGGTITDAGTLSVDVGVTDGKIVQVGAGDKIAVSIIPGLDVSILTSGTLGVGRGGTGLSSLTPKALIMANATGDAMISKDCATDGEILVWNSVTGWTCELKTAGAVTNVGLVAPTSIFTVAGGPVTSAGTFDITLNSQNQNMVFAAPTGSAGAPGFRGLDPSDIPNLDTSKLTSGTLGVDRGGTGLVPGAGNANQFYAINAAGTGSEFKSVVAGSGVTIDLSQPGTIGISATGLGGTVFNIGAVVPSYMSVSPSAITTAGTFDFSFNSQSANMVFAAPTGGSGVPGFRALAASDIPNLDTSKLISGTLGVDRGGTGLSTLTPNALIMANAAGDAMISKDCASDGEILVWNSASGWTCELKTAGAVTNVGLTAPTSVFSIANSPVTGAGTMDITFNSQTMATVFAAPTGANGTPSFRSLAATDIPDLDTSKLTTGTLPVSRGGTGLAPVVGDANKVYGINAAGDNGEYKSVVAGSGVTIDLSQPGTIGISATGLGGTVFNVGATVPSYMSVSPSAITSSGTFDFGFNSQSAAFVFAAPTGASGAPSFRALAATDIPDLDTSKLTSGTLGVTRGGTGLVPGGAGDANKVYGLNAAGTGSEFKSVVAGSGVTIDLSQPGSISISATGLGGTVFNIGAGTGLLGGPITTTGTLAVDVGVTDGQIVQVGSGDKVAVSIIPNLDTSILTTGTLGVERGGTGLVPVVGNANQFYAINPSGTGSEFKSIIAGSGVTLNTGAGSLVISATGLGGTVKNVGLIAPTSVFTVANSPVTEVGTMSLSFNNQNAGMVFAAPTGSAGVPGFRGLVASDIPNLDTSKLTTGTLGVERGGTGLDASTAANGQLMIGNGTGFSLNTLTGGSGISITNTAGSISISTTLPGGSVSNIGVTVPSFMAVTPGSISTAGTFDFSFTSQSGAMVFASPTGSSGAPTFRALAATDIPNLDTSKLTSGTLGVDRGGTGLVPGGASDANKVYGLNAAGTGSEFKSVIAGSGVSIDLSQPGTIGISATGLGGTVFNVGATVPSYMSVSPSAITSSGTFDFGFNSQNAGFVFAAPTGAAGVPGFRALTASDIVSGTLGVDRGGTGIGSLTPNALLMANGTGSAVISAVCTPEQVMVWKLVGGWVCEDKVAGAVTRVDLTVPSIFNVAGGPVTSIGTFDVTLASQGQNTVFAAPTGGAGAPSFRTLAASDIPNLDTSKLTTGTLGVARGGTGLNASAAANGQLLIGNGSGFALNTLTAGSGISITNAAGSISIATTLAGGTVTNVGLTAPTAVFSIANSPVTGAGTMDITFQSQTLATVFAAPTGANGTPLFRALAATDIPNLDTSKLTSGTLGVSRGGTGLVPAAGNANQFYAVNPAGNGAEFKTIVAGSGVTLVPGTGSLVISATGTGGTVTNVGLTAPTSVFTVANSPITGAGTMDIGFASQLQNFVFAAPTGANGTPSFRGLVAADIPNLDTSKLTSGTLGVSRGGTGLVPGGAGDANKVYGLNAAGTGSEFKAMVAGSGVTVTHSAGSLVISATGTGGTVTNIGAIVPSYMSVSPSAITSSGTFDFGFNSQTAAFVFAAPTGASGAPSFRALAATDIPNLDTSKLTSGTLGVARGGTGLNASTAANGQLLIGNGTGFSLNTLTGGSGISITNTAGSISISTTLAGGTVTNVGLTAPTSIFTVANSPVTSAGTMNIGLASQSANMVFAAPTGGAGTPSFRTLAAIDIPNLDTSKLTSGTLGTDRGGTGLVPAGGNAHQFYSVNASGSGAEFKTIVAGTGVTLVPGTGSLVISATGSGGTVTNVGLTAPTSVFTIANSPVTGAGTMNIGFASQTAAFVFAAPTGSAGAPLFRALAATDIPNLDTSKLTTGTLGINRGGTGLVPAAGDANKVYGINAAGTASEFKAMVAGTGVTVTHSAGSMVISATGSGGTVTNIGATVPAYMSVSPAAITSSGTFAFDFSSQSAAMVFASPTGAAGAPSFRALSALDIPNLDASKITTGTLGTARGGTGLNASSAANGQLLIGNGSGFSLNTLTAGSGISITNTAGSISINSTLAGGTVTNVGLTAPTSIFSIANSPVTGAGTMAMSLVSQTQNFVFAAPTGAAGAPSFRALTAFDIPNLDTSKLTSGTLGVNRGGTGLVPGAGNANQFYAINPTGSGSEFKSIIAGTGVTLTTGTGSLVISAAGSGGTVTNVGLTAPTSVFTITNSPVTNTGTMALGFASQNAALVFASPTGAAGAPTFRGLAATDIPNLDTSKLTSGTLGINRGGTGLVAGTGNANQLFGINSSGTAGEFKSLVAGTGLSIAQSNGTITLSAGAGTATQWSDIALGINYASGSVGIGSASPTYKFEVAGPLASKEPSPMIVTHDTTNAKSSTDMSGGLYMKDSANSVAGILAFESGDSTLDLVLGVDAGANAGIRFYTQGTSQMALSGRGLLGIGTTTPTAALDVVAVGTLGSAIRFPRDTTANRPVGDANALVGMMRYNTSLSKYEVYEGTTGWASLATGSVSVSNLWAQGGNSFSQTGTLGTNDAQALAFETNNATRMTINSGGSVGIGTTAPSGRLHVAGTAIVGTTTPPAWMTGNSLFVEGQIIAFDGYTAADGESLAWGNSSTEISGRGQSDGGDYVNFRVAGTDRARILGNGLFGIGTITPTAALDVVGTGTFNSAIRIPRSTAATRPVGNATDLVGMMRYNTDSAKYEVYEETGGWLSLSTGTAGSSQWANNARGIHYSGGSVGIGTNSPSGIFSVASGAGQNAYFFHDNADVGDNNDGQSLYLYRRAAEGDSSLQMFFDQWGDFNFNVNIAPGLSPLARFRMYPVFQPQGDPGPYAPTLAGRYIPNATGIEIASGAGNQDNRATAVIFSGSNTAGNPQWAYIGSVTESTGYSPSLIFGQQTENGPANYQERMRLSGSGLLGIGTSAPTAGLDIATTGTLGSAIRVPRDTAANRPVGNAAALVGMMRYNTDLSKYEVYEGTTGWVSLSTGSTGASQWTNVARGIHYSSGSVGIGTATPSSSLHVETTNTGTSNYAAAFSNLTYSPTSVASFNQVAAASAVATGNGANLANSNLYGGKFESILNGSSNLNYGTGVQGVAANWNANRISGALGAYGWVQNTSTGQITTAVGVEAEVTNSGSGTTTTAYGVRAKVDRTAGVITTGYGVYIDSVDATTKYGVYQADATAPSYFAGNVGIGTNTPTAGLDVATTGTLGSAIRIPRDTTANRPVGAAATLQGMIRYNTSLSKYEVYEGTVGWTSLITGAEAGGSSLWKLSPNGIDTYTQDPVWVAINAPAGTNPAAALDVYGEAKISQNLEAQGWIYSHDDITALDGISVGDGTTAYGSFYATASGGFSQLRFSGGYGGTSFHFQNGGRTGAYMSMPGHMNSFGIYNRAESQVDVYLGTDGGGGYIRGGWFGLGTDAPDTNLHVAEPENTGNDYPLLVTQGSLASGSKTSIYLGKSSSLGANFGYFYDTTAANRRVGLGMIGGSELFTIMNGGNVGIGNTAPGVALDVTATGTTSAIRVPRDTTGNRPTGTATALQGMIRYNTSLSKYEVYEGTTGWASLATGSGSSQWTSVAKGINFSGGSVGVGIASPMSTMQVTESTSPQLTIGPASASNAVAVLSLQGKNGGSVTEAKITANNTGELQLQSQIGQDTVIYNNGTPLATFEPGGEVGIGTTTPDDLLHISAQPGAKARARFSSWGGPYHRHYSVGTDGSTSTTNPPYFDFSIRDEDAGEDRLSISWNTGNVGIGVIDPNSRLTVSGVLALQETTAPAATANFGKIYVKSSDSKLYFKNDSGTEIELGAGGASVASYVAGTNNLKVGTSALGAAVTSGNDNTAIGANTLGAVTTADGNIAIGKNVLNSLSTGWQNIAMGEDVMTSANGATWNIALGSNSLNNLTTGEGNVVVGGRAMQNATTASFSVAVGDQALNAATTAYDNVAVGSGAGQNTIGDNNAFVGAAAGGYTTGGENTILGSFAGLGVGGSSYNRSVIIGRSAGYSLTSGANNILMGYQAGDNLTTGANNIIIGHNIDAPTATVSNRLNIGNLVFGTGISGTGTTLSTGSIGIGTNAPAQKLDVNGNVIAVAYLYSSDRTLKKDIRTVPGLETILRLRGTQFKWRSDNKEDVGLIAQEVEEVFPQLVATNPTTGKKSVQYGNLVAPLIESTKELYGMCQASQAQMERLAAQVSKNSRDIASIQAENEDLKERVERLEQLVNKLIEEKSGK